MKIKKFEKVIEWDDDCNLFDFLGMWVVGLMIVLSFPIWYYVAYCKTYWVEVKK